MEDIGLETDLSKLGIKTQEDFDLITSSVNVERLVNNPRKLTRENLEKLLKSP